MRAKSDHGRRRSETVETRDKNRDVRDLSEISWGEGGGVETEGGSQVFETAEKGGVMKIGP